MDIGVVPVDINVSAQADNDEDILAFDVPDDALERAGGITDRRVITLIYCTQDLSCGDAVFCFKRFLP
jgi:hypothetical protein